MTHENGVTYDAHEPDNAPMTYTNGTRVPINMGHVGDMMNELYGIDDNVPNIHIIMIDALPDGKRAMAKINDRQSYIVYGDCTGMWALPMAQTLYNVSRHYVGLPLNVAAANAFARAL